MTTQQFAHATDRQPIFFGHLTACVSSIPVFCSGLDNHLLCKDRHIVLLAAHRSSFSYHVRKVVEIGSVEYVVRVVAGAVIAGMAGIVNGIVTMFQLVRHAMYSLTATWLGRDVDVSISPEFTLRERPYQALIGTMFGDCSDEKLVASFGGRLGRHHCSSEAVVWAVALFMQRSAFLF
jgi:hypothetical protein